MNAREIIKQPTQGALAERILRPFQEFAHTGASSGILLLICTIIALIWANSPWAASYNALWDLHLRIGIGSVGLDEPLHIWINDGLMTIFFFVVGLEIKREVLVGELSSLRQAILPIVAAVGGMLCPALIYLAFNRGTSAAGGWAIPMATDIAFSLGVLALLGSRIPSALKVFLTAFAIVDDIGAVLVIAIFFHSTINITALIASGIILICVALANVIGVQKPLVYALLGVCLWVAMLLSGLHATIAGILLALLIPSRARIDIRAFVRRGRTCLDEVASDERPGIGLFMNERQQSAIQALETAAEHSLTPLQRMEHTTHPWVAFAIVPLFVLANAGVPISSNFFAALLSPIGLGIILGLIIGKQVGIMLFSWLTVKLGWATLPEGTAWRQMYGVSWVGAIGFTMALFINGLAFGDAGQELFFSEAKSAILVAALIAGVVGWLLLRFSKPGSASAE
ncbi:Na+/H+ antiporter NhaA [Ktedonosporobacter rubrisoli]|uniref:Na(+)/H(+) antiporter NhaA n=1 Tax=Ktedonosporobacter rubrisoli TaxID=2509675 RepID=A0A4P6JVU3_KTERU|nr:Na+/H+ antiporter NhaA [Ktedonosporobacter rubrisoli]QBD79787.1 Na+/H+ antiporter NhaA [Ktedonosporobacter rubrisoli]